MKKVDFLFIYEVKARELENICLLRYELERRGYTVAFINTWNYLNKKVPKISAKVVLSFALYNDAVYKFINLYSKKIKKLINMQWEQIGTVSDDRMEHSHFIVSGRACNASHICWGEMTRDRLHMQAGIEDRKLFLTGHITLDFFRKELIGYYKTREELLKEFQIPRSKKVCLFISSFSYVDLPDQMISNTKTIDLGFALEDFVKVSVSSQKEILNWITIILEKDSETVFIYRPHPAEANNQRLSELAKQYNNFYVISEFSVKQWIIACDVLYTWYSTALAEIYASGKGCHILRPLPIPLEMELSICTEAEFITDFDSFEATLTDCNPGFPIKEEIISYNYYIDRNEPAYIKACDKLIEVYQDDYYLLPKKEPEQITLFRRVKRFYIKKIYRKILKFLGNHTKIDRPAINKYRPIVDKEYEVYCTDMAVRNTTNDEEIKEIIGRIKEALK